MSLTARFYSLNAEKQRPPLPLPSINSLIQAALQMHESHLRRRQVLKAAWLAGLIAGIPGIVSAVITLIKMFSTQ